MSGVLDNVTGHEYNGVWKLWKLASLGLFAAFVVILRRMERTLSDYTARGYLEP